MFDSSVYLVPSVLLSPCQSMFMLPRVESIWIEKAFVLLYGHWRSYIDYSEAALSSMDVYYSLEKLYPDNLPCVELGFWC